MSQETVNCQNRHRLVPVVWGVIYLSFSPAAERFPPPK